jgi:hypothetical protein
MHQYTEKMESGAWIIEISPTTSYGYFENSKTGSGGGLWFEGDELVDYDGVMALPALVASALRGAGYIVDEIFE